MLILIAEDGEDARFTLRLLFEAEGYEVAQAVNGDEAVALALRTTPDLILMDINMPVMDGIAAIGALREHPATARVPIVALSAQTAEWRVRALRAGCDEYVAKPFDFTKLSSTIARLVRRSGPLEPVHI